MKKLIAISFMSLFLAACSSPTRTNTPPKADASAPPSSTAHKSDDEIPASVRAVFPDAQTITKQHKEISSSQIAAIEKETGGKVSDIDHHAYLAFKTEDGARKQIGAASLVSADGKDVIVIYESHEGSPQIKEVRAEGISQAFLDQFKGKGHHDKLQFGKSIKAQGVDEGIARAITSAVYADLMTMNALYGATHKH